MNSDLTQRRREAQRPQRKSVAEKLLLFSAFFALLCVSA